MSAPAMPRAQLTHLAVLGLSLAPSCSATIKTLLMTTAVPSFEGIDQLRGVLHSDAFQPLRRSLKAHELQQLSLLDAETAQRQRLERLFLRLHDVRQLHVPGLVQAQIGSDDGGEIHLDGLQTRIHLARHAGLLPAFTCDELELRSEGRLRPYPQRGH